MYIPEFNRVHDHAEIVSFVHANPFAILVSPSDTGPFASHIPILAREVEGQMVLHGHLAKANPHWELLQKNEDRSNDQESLVIFHGPHAYISPRLYQSRDKRAHTELRGCARLRSHACHRRPEHLLEEVREIINTFDPDYYAQWNGLSDKFRNGMLKHIVGFEIVATRIEAKFKISQNRSKGDQANVIASLATSEDSAASEIAKLMQKQGLGSDAA